MAPKKKGQVMSFSDFTSMVDAEAPTTKTSWADEDIELPSAPMGLQMDSQQAMEYDRSFVRGTGDRIGRGPAGRDQGPPPPPVIDYARLPTVGPFVCFVGNLAFDVSEDDLRGAFPDVRIIGIKIPKNEEQRPRGFAYIDLADQDSLIKALLLSGAMLKGRYIRVDVSEGRPGGLQEKSFASDWRGGVEHQVSDRSGRPNFDRPAPGGAPRAPERVFDRSMMAPVVAEQRNTGGGSGWRTSAQPVNADKPMRASPAPVAGPAEAAKRPVLNLLPRTKPVSGTPEPAQVYSEKGTANPFGAAKPKPIDKPAATSNN